MISNESLRGAALVLFSYALLLALPTSLQAQGGASFNADLCGSCGLQVDRVLEFGDVDGQGIIEDLGSWVRRGPNGRFLVVPQVGAAHSISVFDGEGRFLRRVGREGQGPGEFLDIAGLHLNDDGTLAVSDRTNLRVSLWSSEFEFLDSNPVRLLLGNDVLRFSDGVLATNAMQPGATGSGAQVHVTDSLGIPYLTLDAHRGEPPGEGEDALRRRLALSGDTALWSGHVDTYELHLWSRGGELLRTLGDSEPWSDQTVVADGASPPRLTGMWEEGGVLWLLVLVPDPDWRSATVPSTHPRGYSIDDYSGYRDTLLQARDTRTGELLGQHRFDVPVFNFVDGGHVAFVEEDDQLVPRMVVVSFDLADGGGAR